MTGNAHQEDAAQEDGDDAHIGRAFWLSLGLIALVVGGGVTAWVLRWPEPPKYDEPEQVVLPTRREATPLKIPSIPFTDITDKAGLSFMHENGAYGDKLLPETMGGGCAFFDYDNDGDADILLVNSCPWPWRDDHAEATSSMALYRNDGSGQFDDVTEDAGLQHTLYGMGCAVADFNGDGWKDLFLTAVGPNRLFQNNGGHFQDVTDSTGVAGDADAWSTGAAWLDIDNDGDLDLFVCNYVRWSREIDLSQDFRLVGVGRAYGPPTAFEGSFARLYRNEGGGPFTDISADAGVEIRNPNTGVPVAKSLAVRPVDLDDDGLIDIVVANDTVRNFVFHNQANGTFAEIGAIAGVAFDSSGNARGAMGIDAAAFRNSDTLGVAIGNFANEMTALYVAQNEPLQFVDAAISTGLGPPSRSSLTFGLFFFDADLDGRLDLFAANGHLEQEINQVQTSQHYEQSPQLFWNCGTANSSEFVQLPTEHCSADFCAPLVGRGASYADIDGDGDLDVLVTTVDSRPRLLRNDQRTGHHWLRVRLIGTDNNQDCIGARVQIHVGDQVQHRDIMPTRSYLSQVEPIATFGLGDAEAVDRVVVRWPDGTSQSISSPPVDQLTIISYEPSGASTR